MRVLQITGFALLWVWTGVQVAEGAACVAFGSFGNEGVGIYVEDAPTCITQGGVGCINVSGCRYCMKFSTDQSKHLLPCTSTPTPTVTPKPTTTPTVASTSNSTPTNDDCTDPFRIA